MILESKGTYFTQLQTREVNMNILVQMMKLQ